MRIPVGVPGGGVQGGGGGWWGVGFPAENEGKGKGVGRVEGVGWGRASMRTHLSKLPFSNLPLSFSPKFFALPRNN